MAKTLMSHVTHDVVLASRARSYKPGHLRKRRALALARMTKCHCHCPLGNQPMIARLCEAKALVAAIHAHAHRHSA